jgi:hypothetical protein
MSRGSNKIDQKENGIRMPNFWESHAEKNALISGKGEKILSNIFSSFQSVACTINL